MLTLAKIRIENFLSVSSPSIELTLKNRGVVGVFGRNDDTNASDSNGAGKSALFSESLAWCLFGETLRGISSDDVVNRKTGKNCSVSLFIEEDMSSYEIIRTRKMSKAKKANDLLVYLNGQNITKGTNQDTQELINSIIGMDFNTFVQSVLLSYGTTPFSQMTDKEKNEVFENILELDKLAKVKEVASKDANKINSELTRINIEIEKQKLYVNDLKIRSGKLKQASNEFEETKSRTIQDLRNTLNELIETQETLKVSVDSIPSIKDALDKANKDLLDKQTVYNAFLSEISKVESSLVDQRASIRSIIESLKRDVKASSAASSGVASKAGGTCPECLQNVSTGHVDAVLQRHEAHVRDTEAKIVSLSEKLQTVNENLVSLGERKESTRKLLDNEVGQIQSDILSLTKKEMLAKRDAQDLKKTSQSIFDYRNRIEEEEKTTNTFEEMYKEADVQYKQHLGELKTLEQSASTIREEHKYLSIVVDMFGNGGIKSRIIDCVLPFLQGRTQKYLDLLSDSKISVSFSTTKELKKGGTKNELLVNAMNSQGADVYKGNSAGEKQRIDLSIGWALGDLAASRSSKRIRLKVCDEIFTHIDSTGADALFKLLNKAAEEYESVFCITHDTNLQSQFTNVITVVKRGNSSYLLEE